MSVSPAIGVEVEGYEAVLDFTKPWFRTVYIDNHNQKSAVDKFAGRIIDLAMGVQVQALNSSVQAFSQGVKVAVDATKATAKAMPMEIPGASVVTDFADRVGQTASQISQGATKIVNRAAASPATEPAGTAVADMLFGPVAGAAAFPVTTSAEAAESVAATPRGQEATSIVATTLNGLLDFFSVFENTTSLDTMKLRETWLAMTTGPGKTALGDISDLATGMVRVFMGDTVSLSKALQNGVVNVYYGWQYGLQNLSYPKTPIGLGLSQVSGLVVQYQPITFISALATGDLRKVANALLEDSENILLTSVFYPTSLVGVVLAIARFLSIGLRDCNEVEGYVLAEQEIVKKFPQLNDEAHLDQMIADWKGAEASPEALDAYLAKYPDAAELFKLMKQRPFTCTEFEFYVGLAKRDEDKVAKGLFNHEDFPVGVFPQALIDLAQDTAYWYSAQILGKEEALKRMYRVYGKNVRDRMAADPSLPTVAGLDAARERALGDTSDATITALTQKIQDLSSIVGDSSIYTPQDVHKRLRAAKELLAELQKSRKAA